MHVRMRIATAAQSRKLAGKALSAYLALNLPLQVPRAQVATPVDLLYVGC